MQFGVFSVGDVTPDPTTGRTHTEAERIQAMVTIALTAEEVGLITTNDPVKIAEDYAMLQHLAVGRVDLMLGRMKTCAPRSPRSAPTSMSPRCTATVRRSRSSWRRRR